VAARSYGQYCGLARALELVGERWALLVVRDLLVGPRRFTDLRRGLPRIPTNVLSERLKELEQAGIVRRRALPRPAASIVYELTPYGQQLEEVVMRLGVWGAQALGDPRPDEIITSDSMTVALRSTFRPAAATGVQRTYEFHFGPSIVVYARVESGVVQVAEGSAPSPGADLVVESGPAVRELLAGELSPREALESGRIRVLRGEAELLEEVARLFQIPPRPA
jgi:DNA-binding HxlR family transcriptional regulator